MSAALDARGLKRVCVGCGIRFYDFNKRPIECPNCDAEFTGELKVKGRRGRAAGIAEIEDDEIDLKKNRPGHNDDAGETEDIEQNEDTVSLEEVEEGEDDDLDMEDEALDDLETLDDLEDEDEDIEADVEDDKE